MAIGTDALIDFFGTADALGNTTSAVTNTSFSDGTNDLNAWTNDDDAPLAVAVLTWQYASGTVDEDGSFNLYAQIQNPGGQTAETGVPNATHQHIFLGAFPVKDAGASTDVSAVIEIALPNVETSTVYHFYIENQSDVTMAAGWELEITPKTVGPHA